MIHGRDHFLVEVGKMVGLTIRELHPPEAAAGLAGSVRVLSWFDSLRQSISGGIGFLALLVVNAVVGFWEEHQAGNTIAALKKHLALMARVERDGLHRFVVDLGSTNGTYLNTERLIPLQPYRVHHNTRMILGSLHMVITFGCPPPTA